MSGRRAEVKGQFPLFSFKSSRWFDQSKFFFNDKLVLTNRFSHQREKSKQPSSLKRDKRARMNTFTSVHKHNQEGSCSLMINMKHTHTHMRTLFSALEGNFGQMFHFNVHSCISNICIQSKVISSDGAVLVPICSFLLRFGTQCWRNHDS